MEYPEGIAIWEIRVLDRKGLRHTGPRGYGATNVTEVRRAVQWNQYTADRRGLQAKISLTLSRTCWLRDGFKYRMVLSMSE